MSCLRQDKTESSKKKIFLFLILYRWITLINATVLVFISAKSVIEVPIIIVIIYNSALSIFSCRLHDKAKEHPVYVAIDLMFCISILSMTGGWASSFYLYGLSPILTAALFYEFKGAFYFASAFSFLYMLALYHNGFSIEMIVNIGRLDSLISNHVTFFLIGIFFAYPSRILNELEFLQKKLIEAKESLELTQNELKTANKLEPLSKRELQVLNLVARGKSNKEIADSLFLSESTVKTHLSRIFRKLEIKSRAEAVSLLKANNNSNTVEERSNSQQE